VANRKREDKVIGAFIGGGVGAVGGPLGVAVGGGVGAWLGHRLERWLDKQ
jgi:outer membrane lipoprotein SlyB